MLKKTLRHSQLCRQIWRRVGLKRAARSLLMIKEATLPGYDSELTLFSSIRNECHRLPYFLNYYRDRGVDHFVLVDHDSTDSSAALLKSQSDVTLYQTADSYTQWLFWINYLTKKYAKNRFCLIVDADEFLHFPYEHQISLRELCSFLERQRYTAVPCILLDMYGDNCVDDKHDWLTDPLESAPFFDRGPYTTKVAWKPFEVSVPTAMIQRSFFGGLRSRLYGINPCLSKYPLVYIEEDTFIASGAHLVEGVKPATICAALLHFKFMGDYRKKLEDHYKRSTSWSYHFELKRQAEGIESALATSLFSLEHSVRYESDMQLLRDGLMTSTVEYNEYVRSAIEGRL